MSVPENALNVPTEEITPTAEPVETTVPEGVIQRVDETPDPETVKSEIETLRAEKEQLAKDNAREKENLKTLQKQRNRAGFATRTGQPVSEEIPAAAAAAPTVGDEPKEEDFTDYNEYVKALAGHQADIRVKAARTEWEADQAKRDAAGTANQREETLHAKLDEGVDLFDDFTEVVFDETAVQITPMIVDLLADCENPAGVAYYLAKNRTEGIKVSRMTPTQAARAMAQIETNLPANPAPNPSSTTKKHSTAPDPIKPVGSSAEVTKDPSKMTQAEFEKYREGQGARHH